MRVVAAEREKIRKDYEASCLAEAKNNADRNPFDCFSPDKVGALPPSRPKTNKPLLAGATMARCVSDVGASGRRRLPSVPISSGT